MTGTLALTALLMGLAGGPHCVAMCGAACGGLTAAARRPGWRAQALFQAGRFSGYAAAGAVAAAAVQGFAWMSSHAAALRPAWTLFHLAVLAWGLALLVLARQPAWVAGMGRGLWQRVRPVAGSTGGLFGAGAAWILMPCGLLYSALLVASLAGGPVEGAATMALFALGSGAWLAAAPHLFGRLRRWAGRFRQEWGTRAAGLLLAGSAAWALWMDVAHRIAVWCGLAAP